MSKIQRTASAPTVTNYSIVNVLSDIRGIIDQALAHHVSVYCSQEPEGHAINQHKADLSVKIPGRLEDILGTRNISDGEWLAVRKLQDFIGYATVLGCNWEDIDMFEMMSGHFTRVHKYVSDITKHDDQAARPIYYDKPEGQSRGHDMESSGV